MKNSIPPNKTPQNSKTRGILGHDDTAHCACFYMNSSLNFRRIFLFSIFVLIARVLAGIFTWIVFFENIILAGVHYVFINFIIYSAVIIIIFIGFGMKQESFLYVHATLVVILSEVIDVVVSFLFFGEYLVSPLLLLEYGIYAMSVFVGVSIGKSIRRPKIRTDFNNE